VYNTTTIQGQQQIRNSELASRRKNSSDSVNPKDEEDSFIKKDKFLNHPLLTAMKDLIMKPDHAHVGDKPIGFGFYHKRMQKNIKNSLVYK